MTAGHERPREEWIEIPVPALVSEASFSRAQELLQENKKRSRRRTIQPSIVQGLVSCQKCGYAFARTSTQTTARKIHYYKCIGSDSWRKLGGPVCDNGRFVRQDLLDQIVWAEVIRLLEDPTLIQLELDRRLAAARSSDPAQKRVQSLQRELVHVGKGIERLLTAYQEELMSIDQMRERMPALRQRDQALRAELQAIADQANERAVFLRLAETLTAFLNRLRSAADTLSIIERQRIVRLVVKDVLIGDDTITIRHSISIPQGQPHPEGPPPNQKGSPNYLLCKGRDRTPLGSPFHAWAEQPVFHHPGVQERPDKFQQPLVIDTLGDTSHQSVVIDSIEEFLQVEINAPAAAFGDILLRLCHCLMSRPPRSKTVAVIGKLRVPPLLQNLHDRLLEESIQHRWNAQLAHSAVRFRYFYPLHRLWSVCPAQ